MTASWPLAPDTERSVEETEGWWRECYVPSAAMTVLAGHHRWRLITGGPGSGRTVALAALRHTIPASALVLDYETRYWPRAADPLKQGSKHLGQFMALASRAIRDRLTAAPTRIDALSATQLQFVRWLIDKYADRRAYTRWVDGLPADQSQRLLDVAAEELYASETAPVDVGGQIDELLGVTRRLGYDQIVILADTDGIPTPDQVADLLDLFGWLELMQHGGLSVVCTAPEALRPSLVRAARGRVSVIPLQWTAEETRLIADRHVRAATEGRVESLSHLIAADALGQLERMVEAEYDGPAPRGMVDLAHTALSLAVSQPWPLTADDLPTVRRRFFAEYLKLRLDPTLSRHGIWRGPRFIALDERPFDFLEKLYHAQGAVVETDHLTHIAGSKGNVHTLASRVRKVVEPDSAAPVYVQNQRGAGYWLERFV